jgi:hypothetical protein
MSCAARYSETTSLEFILNPFKFFFTNYVAKIAPYPPPNIPHLETQIRSPTILRSHHSECAAIAGPRCCLSMTSLPSQFHGPSACCAARHDSHAPLHESSRSSNDLTATPDSLSAPAHFVALNADVMRFPCPVFFSSTRSIAIWCTTASAVLHVRSPCSPKALLSGASSSGSSTHRRFCSAPYRVECNGSARLRLSPGRLD